MENVRGGVVNYLLRLHARSARPDARSFHVSDSLVGLHECQFKRDSTHFSLLVLLNIEYILYMESTMQVPCLLTYQKRNVPSRPVSL